MTDPAPGDWVTGNPLKPASTAAYARSSHPVAPSGEVTATQFPSVVRPTAVSRLPSNTGNARGAVNAGDVRANAPSIRIAARAVAPGARVETPIAVAVGGASGGRVAVGRADDVASGGVVAVGAGVGRTATTGAATTGVSVCAVWVADGGSSIEG